MSALKPIENARVLGVLADSYPINKKCAHPECNEEAVDPHHCFPRSRQIGSSYFVAITFDTAAEAKKVGAVMRVKPLKEDPLTIVIPHAVGLCRVHHDQVEQHFAWIKLDLEDGVWSWWETNDGKDGNRGPGAAFVELGALNPQPGSVEGRPKRKKFQGEARKKRRTISIRVPDGADENGAELLDELVETLESRIVGEGKHRPIYYTLIDSLNFTVTNADATDFDLGDDT